VASTAARVALWIVGDCGQLDSSSSSSWLELAWVTLRMGTNGRGEVGIADADDIGLRLEFEVAGVGCKCGLLAIMDRRDELSAAVVCISCVML